MKTLVFSLLGLGAGAGCQPESAPRLRSATVAPTHVAAAAPVATAATIDTPVQPDSLTLAVLRQYDPGPLLQHINSGQQNEPVRAMNGFFGADLYHLEVALSSVRRSPQQPGLYVVQGKDRYKGVITPLAGTVRFGTVRLDTVHATDYAGRRVVATSYTFLGTYELREAAASPGAGIFRGQLVVQASPDDEGGLLAESVSDSLSRGGMVLFDGTWTSRATKQAKAAVWVGDLYHYRGHQVAADFFIGEREPAINPKYAKLGWTDYWENDEWWADSPRPIL